MIVSTCKIFLKFYSKLVDIHKKWKSRKFYQFRFGFSINRTSFEQSKLFSIRNSALCSKIVLIKMQSFELLRKHFAKCGVESSPKNHPFNWKNLTVLILLCMNVSSLVILLNEDSTFDEITDTSFRSVSFATCGLIYLIIVCKTSKLLEFIKNLTDAASASE